MHVMQRNTVKPGYNNIGLCDTSSITSHILYYQLDRGSTVVKVLCYKVAGSIPTGVTGFFMTLGSTQPLIEMSTRSISWG